MIKRNRKKNKRKVNRPSYLDYRQRFEEFMRQGLPIYSRSGKELILKDGETFVQAYDPHDPRRQDLPVSWFISDRGNVISAHRATPTWLPGDKSLGARDSQHFMLNDHIKVVKTYDLLALVFGDQIDTFGQAGQLMDQNGVYAFGSQQDTVHIHHKKSVKDHPELVNNPDNLQALTANVHKALHSLKDNASVEQQVKWAAAMGDQISQQAPGHVVTMLAADEERSINTDQIPRQLIIHGVMTDLPVTRDGKQQTAKLYIPLDDLRWQAKDPSNDAEAAI